MSAFAALIMLTALLLTVFLRWRKKNFEYFRNLGIPGPEPSILSGNLREYHRKGRHLALQKWCDTYGNIFGFYNGDVPTLVVKDLDFLHYVFVSNFKNFAERGITMRTDQVHSSLGSSMIHAKESQWRFLRGCTSPEFTSCKLKAMMPFLTEQGDVFMKVLGKLADERREESMLESFQALSMDFFCRANFGIDSNFQHTTASLFYVKAENVIPGMMIGPFHAIAQCTTTLGVFMKPFFWINRILGSFTMNIFAEEMKKVVRLRTKNPKLRRNDMLQNLLEAELHSKHFTKGGLQEFRRLSEEELVLLTTVLFLGGFQTTAVTLSFMSMLLAMHPEIQEKVRQEVKDAISSSGCLDYDTTVHKLNYMTQVMNETLRLYPPSLTFHTRTAKNSFEYKGTTFKAGTCIMAPVMQLHRDPQYWTDPNKFDPDRFSPENEGTYCKRAFQPFGVGPRCCVGYKLALFQVLYFTARMVQNFKMELGDAHKGAIEVQTIGMMASPGDGSWMKFTRI
ncbi:cytochrome P450 3A14-like [Ixodes scapularis]|uniref:cytochrome P450 3A14-like n=1 Tax=Ixodes scapularis TaxID=6945 RepID=UPI001A9FDA46|nr:cytochrome P450 3A14-like [Ixodes scapularis]